MYRLKLISNSFGIDDKSPIYPTLESARRSASAMLLIYHGKVRVEIYQQQGLTANQRRLVETHGSPG